MALLQGVFVEACRTFALPESDLAELMQEHNEYTGCQALSYLPLGSEPLYSEGQVQQVCALRAPTENSCVYAHSPLLHLSNTGALAQRSAAAHRGRVRCATADDDRRGGPDARAPLPQVQPQ